MQKFTDIFTRLPLFDSSKQKYSAGKSRIYPKSSSVSVWEKVIGGGDWNIARSIIQSSDGGYVVAGAIEIIGGYVDFYVVKLAPDGTAAGCHDRFQSPVVSTGGIVTDAVPTSYSITPESYSIWTFRLCRPRLQCKSCMPTK